MQTLTWINEFTELPDPSTALPDGLLAVGGDLSLSRLTEAYKKGIFPWFNHGDPILWWSPDPRMVLACANFNASHTLRKKLRQLANTEQNEFARVKIKMNTALPDVIRACAAPRATQSGTWINADIQAAYIAWHYAGHVQSIETWIDGKLMGGLYGVNLGQFFFGESMFSQASDASKLALAYLVRFLIKNGVKHIDCQQQTNHLASLGARPIPRAQFCALLKETLNHPTPIWGQGQLLQCGTLASS